MNVSIEYLLNLRYRFESIVGDRRLRYDLPSYNGTIESLTWFVERAHKSNRFRKHFDEAHKIALEILDKSK